MEIVPLGDCAALVRAPGRFQDAPEQTLDAVLETLRRLEAARIPGVIEFAPAYNSVAVFYDPSRIGSDDPTNIFETLSGQIREIVLAPKGVAPSRPENRRHEVPICCESEFAPDLETVAEHAGVDCKEVIDLYCGVEYRVACIGFTPGFPYLIGLPEKLATPRRSDPRKEVAAGSVGIGGWQTGIYPVKSPGGWNVIGRTPLRLFDPQRIPPALFLPGDCVRFRTISRAEFEKL